MKWLFRVNVAAVIVYASFVAAFLVADVWIFPELSALTPPPEAVGVAIRQGDDADGLREIALVLYDHVAEQGQAVNALVDSTVFWARLHFLLALGLACFNVAMLIRIRRLLAKPGSGEAVGL
ncbi:MAG: hypothetical protein JSW48_12105 [Betaproteobacteria bacterium]|jgi:hypothetical protein|nr:MAG: hypothetical protein JSW48_12105 [Betaproteobacteria bacterium]